MEEITFTMPDGSVMRGHGCQKQYETYTETDAEGFTTTGYRLVPPVTKTAEAQAPEVISPSSAEMETLRAQIAAISAELEEARREAAKREDVSKLSELAKASMNNEDIKEGIARALRRMGVIDAN